MSTVSLFQNGVLLIFLKVISDNGNIFAAYDRHFKTLQLCLNEYLLKINNYVVKWRQMLFNLNFGNFPLQNKYFHHRNVKEHMN